MEGNDGGAEMAVGIFAGIPVEDFRIAVEWLQ
jgi:hypothetical protein